MKYKKSHRDQKVRPLFIHSIQEGCNILEIDVQSAIGKIVLGHDWRPKLPFLFDCTLEYYLFCGRIYNTTPETLFLQVDIKEICLFKKSREKFVKLLIKALEPVKSKATIIVSANEGFKRPLTALCCYVALYEAGFKCYMWDFWKKDKDIETVDLWKGNRERVWRR